MYSMTATCTTHPPARAPPGVKSSICWVMKDFSEAPDVAHEAVSEALPPLAKTLDTKHEAHMSTALI